MRSDWETPSRIPAITQKTKTVQTLRPWSKVDTSGLDRAGDRRLSIQLWGNNNVEAKAVRPVKVLPNTEYETEGLPICMYHYVYDPASPPENIDSNFISTDALAEEMEISPENGYYFPTMAGSEGYVDGSFSLPEKSIVLL